MKIRHLLLSASCALFALSCQKDVVEDVVVGPNGETYFDMSFTTLGISTGTKVGFDPTGADGSYLYWTDTESIKVVDASGESPAYTIYDAAYTAPESGGVASFAVSDFEVADGASEITIFATSGMVEPTSAGSGTYEVKYPTLDLTHDGEGYDYDTFGAELPFVSSAETAGVKTTSGVTSYTDGAPALTMLPIFHSLRLSMANVDDNYTTQEVGYISAKVTLSGESASFYTEIALNPANISYDPAVDDAVYTALNGDGVIAMVGSNPSTTEITSSVTYTDAVSLASLKEFMIPLVSIGANEYAENFTVEVEFYTEAEGTLVASASQEFAYNEFKYGEINEVEISADSFAYDLNKAPAVESFTLTAQGTASAEVKVDWVLPTDARNIAGVNIYYGKKVADGEEQTYEETPITILGTDVTTYTLGTNEALDWNADYSIYVATYTESNDETASAAQSVTTSAQVDLAYNSTDELYEIYTAKGLVAFAQITRGEANSTDAKISGFEWPSDIQARANAQVMASIDMADYANSEHWDGIGDDLSNTKYYSGTFDGGSAGDSGIEITNFTSVCKPLFRIISDAKIKNLTISGVQTPLTENTSSVGGLAEHFSRGNAVFENVINNVAIKEFGGETFMSTYDQIRKAFVEYDSGATATYINCQYPILLGDTPFSTSEDAPVEPIIKSVAQNAAGTAVVVTWDVPADATDYDLVKVSYNCKKGDLGSFSFATGCIKDGELVLSKDDFGVGSTYQVTYVASVNITGVKVATNIDEFNFKILLTAPSYDIVLNNDIYEIYTAKGLKAFAALVNGDTSYTDAVTKASDSDAEEAFVITAANRSADAKVMAEIDMDGVAWTPIGISGSEYTGIFDGGDNAISNLSTEVGFVNKLHSGGLIRDVKLVNPVVKYDGNIGSIGTIVSYATSGVTITGCEVVGGSVTLTSSSNTVWAGAIAGTFLGTMSNSTSSCSVTIAGKPYNNGTDSRLVGSGVCEIINSTDDYTEGTAAALADAGTISSVVPEYSVQDGSQVIVTFAVTGENIDSRKLWYKSEDDDAFSSKSVYSNNSPYTFDGLTPDKEYTFYISTYNYVGVETKGAEMTATTFNADSYADATLPTITATTEDSDIELTWDVAALPEGLQEIRVAYGSNESETIDAAVIATGSYTMTAKYNSTDTSIETYVCRFATSAATENMVEKVGAAIAISEVSSDIVLNEGVYEIKNADGLLAFASIVNGYDSSSVPTAGAAGFEWSADGAAANAAADAKIVGGIDLTGKNWTPMVAYAGNFDGGGNYVDEPQVLSFAPVVNECAIVGLAGAQGLFASTADGAVIANVDITVDITATAASTAALVGTNTGALTVTKCVVRGDLDGGQVNTAGVLGTPGASFNIEYVQNEANINGGSNSAGIVGQVGNVAYKVNIVDCVNKGDITVPTTYKACTGGGVVGWVRCAPTSTIADCKNYGTITGGIIGGVIGEITNPMATVTRCSNYGVVSGSVRQGVGGVIGNCVTVVTELSSLYNYGVVNSGNPDTAQSINVGGIIGSLTAGALSNSENKSGANVNSVKVGDTGVGGVVGFLGENATLNNCKDYAQVTIGGTFSDGAISGGSDVTYLYGVSGAGSEGTKIESNTGSDVVALPAQITLNKFEAQAVGSSTYDIEWSYAGDDASNVESVLVYTTFAPEGDGPLAADMYSVMEVPVMGDNAVTSTTLGFTAGKSTYVYLETVNASGVTTANVVDEAIKSQLLTDSESPLGFANPLAVTISGEVVTDATYYATADGDYAANTYAIHTAKGLTAFANIVNGNGNTSGATIEANGGGDYTWADDASANAVVTKSIDLAGVAWTPMASYAGTFDGANGLSADNDTESGIAITNLEGSKGLFESTVSTAVVKNVTLCVSLTNVGAFTGAISSMTSGLVSYCRTSGTMSGASNTGSFSGIAGKANDGLVIEYANSNVNLTAGGSKATHCAGIVAGLAAGSLEVRYCNNYGNIKAQSAGGISGYLGSGHTFIGCNNYGTITTNTESGGIINSTKAGNYVMCNNYGDIVCGGAVVGGIVGNAYSGNIHVTACSNEGDISGTAKVGGIVGDTHSNTYIDGAYAEGSIANSKNTGVVKGTDAATVGGLVGSFTNGTLTNYLNDGEVLINDVNSNANCGLVGSGSTLTPDSSCMDLVSSGQ